MTPGVPIYLVSACTTGAEFVAAFRRYADRSGLFIPMADPIPVGKKGRFAVTLTDGGVMVEGEAEVVSSTRTPSVLHGRIGMTLRFSEPDEPSKIVLVELEKARLSMKPPPPSVPPRPAIIPDEPRAVPPAAAGRIDAGNALAECVAIGELGALVAASAPKQPSTKFVVPSVAPVPEHQRSRTPSGPPPMHLRPQTPPSPSPGGSGPVLRPKQPSTPPTSGATAIPATSSVRATQPSAVVPPPAPPPAASPLMPRIPSGPRSPTMALPTLLRTPAGGTPSGSQPVVELPSGSLATGGGAGELGDEVVGFGFEAARPHRQIGPVPTVDEREDDLGRAPPQASLDDDLAPAGPRPTPVVDGRVPLAPIVAVHALHPTAIEVDEPTDLTEMPLALLASSDPRAQSPSLAALDDGVPVQLPPAQSRPTSNRLPTIAGTAPLRRPAVTPQFESPIVEVATIAPPPPPPLVVESGRTSRRTVLGIAVVPDGMTVLPAPSAPMAAQEHDTSIITAPPPPAPTIEEPTPSGNWTFAPGDDKPTIEPRIGSVKQVPAGPLTGDWSIAVLPDSPEGWTEPSKIEKRAQTVPGPPESTVSGSRTLDTTSAASEPTYEPEEAKVQIDATLIGPLPPMEIDESLEDPTILPPDLAAPPSRAPSSADGALGPPIAAVASSSSEPIEHTAQMPQLSYPVRAATNAGDLGFTDGAFAPRKKSRLPLIVIGVLLVIAAGVLVFFLLSQRKHAAAEAPPTTTTTTTTTQATTPTPTPTPDLQPVSPPITEPSAGSATPSAVADGSAAVAAGSATPAAAGSADSTEAAGSAAVDPVVTPTVTAAKPTTAPDAAGSAASVATTPSGTCRVQIDTSPGAVDILVAGVEVGTTPTTLQLPCGAEVKLVMRKARYSSVVRAITPGKTSKVRAKLEKITYVVKLSSSPPGATVSVGGKSIGVTPTTSRLPAMDAETIVFSKPGYTSESQKFTAKQNNQTVHQILKKKGK